MWWNTVLTVTVATVLTQYLKYNNTVIPKTTTVYNVNATNSVSVPTGIIPGWLPYSSTYVNIGSTLVVGTTTITSPTPYVAVNSALYLTGTSGYDLEAGVSTCLEAPTGFDYFADMIQLGTEFDFIPATSTFWSGATYISIPSQMLSTIEAIPGITSSFPMVASCDLPSASGQPSVHVPVSALTVSATSVIQMSGAYTPSPDNLPSSAAPASAISEVAPSSSQQAPPVSSQASPPKPTTTVQAPSNQGGPSVVATPTTPHPGTGTVIIGGSTIAVPASSALNGIAPISVGASVIPISYATGSASGIVLPNGGTLPPGSVTVYSGVTISLVPSETAIVVGGSTIPLAPVTAAAAPASILVGSSYIPITYATASGGGIVLPNSQTLQPGSATVYNGVTISLSPSETAIIIGTNTVPLTPPATPAAASILIGSSLLPVSFATASGGGVILPNGATLLPGSTTVYNGVTISLSPYETAVVVGTSTIPLSPGTTPAPVAASLLLGSTFIPISYATASGGGIILPNGSTLLPGSVTVYNGVTISLSPSETAIVVGTTTIPLHPPTSTSGGLGGYIVSGLGGGATGSRTAAGYTGPQATGAAARVAGVEEWVWGGVVCILGVWFGL